MLNIKFAQQICTRSGALNEAEKYKKAGDQYVALQILSL